MFNKILIGYDGTSEGDHALNISAIIAKKFGSEIKALHVLPEHTEFTKSFSEIERKSFDSWVEDNLKKKNIRKLDKHKDRLNKKGIKFSYDINYGVPYKQILDKIKKNDFNLVVLGKGRFGKNSILGGTAKKVLRNGYVSTLVSGYGFKKKSFKKILVPTDVFNVVSKDLSFAIEFADVFNSKVYLLNIVEMGDHKYPAEVIEKLKGDSYNTLSQKLLKENVINNVEPRVRVAQNAWIGIRDFIEDEVIDLVVMMSYGGEKIRTEFLGSVAEKVIEKSTCPVIALSP